MTTEKKGDLAFEKRALRANKYFPIRDDGKQAPLPFGSN
jgi:hypothetical protein